MPTYDDMTSLFGSAIETPEWICLGAALVAAVAALMTRFLPIWRTAMAGKQQKLEAYDIEFPADSHVPFLSVIVYTFTTEDSLMEYLEEIMNQDYPNYEVILVNEGGFEVSAALGERLREIYPERLYVTFIPPDSHNLSRRKLAQTVGMKAAKGEMVLTTASNCIIPSRSWLSLMMQPFCHQPDIDVVLGYSHIELSNLHGPWKWYRQFDETLTACQWIGAAINNHPYRGDGYNLVFRKRHFFDQKGYSKTLHLMDGDDDLFINDITTGDNTDVMIAPEAILTYDWGDAGNRIFRELKERYNFTARLLPRMPFLRAGIGSAMQWVVFACVVAASIAGLPDYLPLAVGAGIFLLFNIMEIYIYRKAARALGSMALFWSLPLFFLWHPIANIIFTQRIRRHRKKHFTFS